MNFKNYNNVVLPFSFVNKFKGDVIAFNKGLEWLSKGEYSLSKVNVIIIEKRMFSYKINGANVDFFIHSLKNEYHFNLNKPRYIEKCRDEFILFLETFYLVESSLNRKKEMIKKEKPKERKEKKEAKKVEKKHDTVYVSNKAYQYEERGKRHNQRHTESWSVRGHWRHYKNGKTVFIEPFTKGKKNSGNKTYIIKGE